MEAIHGKTTTVPFAARQQLIILCHGIHYSLVSRQPPCLALVIAREVRSAIFVGNLTTPHAHAHELLFIDPSLSSCGNANTDPSGSTPCSSPF